MIKARPFGFTKKARLGDAKVYAQLLRARRISAAALQLQAVPNQTGIARLGLAVSKRLAKRAVDRNRVKRAIREAFRQHPVATSPVDLLVSLRAKIVPKSKQAKPGTGESLLAQARQLLDQFLERQR